MWHNDSKKGFGLAIKVWRGKLQISQEELAWRAGLHRTYVADIERGARNPSLLSIEKIARALKISFSTLFEPMGSSPSRQEESPKPGVLVTVLLVEGNPSHVEMTVRAFRDANVKNEFHIARTFADAVKYLWHPAGRENPLLLNQPRLILLDLNLSRPDGMEFLRRLKADPLTRGIPVVILSSPRDTRTLQECRSLGFEMFLPKPVDFAAFCSLVPQLAFRWGLLMDPEGRSGPESHN